MPVAENVGGFDRVIRLVVGSVLLLAGVAGFVGLLVFAAGPVPQAIGSGLVFVVGAIPTVTGYGPWCPVHRALGRDTYRPAAVGPSMTEALSRR